MTKIYIQTHGCSTNFSESEVMAGLLAEAGFEIIDNKESADIIMINVCTVKGENTALREIRKTKEEFPSRKLIVAGCLTKVLIKNARKIDESISLVNTHNIKSICEFVEEVSEGNIVGLLAKEKEVKINLPKIRKNQVIGIIPILNSCKGNCSYCSVKAVKGELFSYPIEAIIKEVNNCLDEGCKEIWITSQDNASYMLDMSEIAKKAISEHAQKPSVFDKNKISKLPELLEKITGINKEFMVRIGMMNLNHLLPVADELIKIYKNKKIFKFLHIPIQSGNNEILKLMNRKYTVDDFKRIVDIFRKEIPDITISTDIICGFPTESEQQFNDSLSLIKEIRPEILNISRFQARAGTKAAKMKQVNGSITKNRSRILTEIFGNISRMNNEKWLNWKGTILIDEKGKNNSWTGRNFAYKPVVVKGDFKLGQEIKVEIENITSWDLRGNII